MHMKYLLLGTHELFSVYLISSASKQICQVEANFNAEQKGPKSVNTFSLRMLCVFTSQSNIAPVVSSFLMFLLISSLDPARCCM